ncbi:MAG: TetR/AcrR family transcriptional regulator [Spirochaetes bacterium]|nr:TetR/AcrR family transcriptional regulator [Spirochaetota bacterium]
MDDRRLKAMIKDRFRELSFRMGVRGITIDMIARECGISKKTFYKFFASKDELAESILDDMIAEYKKGVAAIDGSENDPLDKLYRLIELPFSLFGDISTTLVKDVTLLYPHIEKRLYAVRESHRKTVIKTYVSGVRAGYFKKINPSFVASFLAGAGTRVINSRFILENNMTLNEILSSFQDIMLSGLLKDRSSADRNKGKKANG